MNTAQQVQEVRREHRKKPYVPQLQKVKDKLQNNSKRVGSCLIWTKKSDQIGIEFAGNKVFKRRVHTWAYMIHKDMLEFHGKLIRICSNKRCIEPKHIAEDKVERIVNINLGDVLGKNYKLQE